jgi:alpha-methylacyl-CoA racemase
MNRGKRSVQLDLKSAEGRQHALFLIERADALIDVVRPGVMERLAACRRCPANTPERCCAKGARRR